MNPLHFVYHIPKTGGQTIRDHLGQQLIRGEQFEFLGRWNRGDHFDHEAVLDAAARRPPGELVALGGHPLHRALITRFPGRPLREVVFIRDPAARIVSHYNFSMTMKERSNAPIVPFDQYVEQYTRNGMTRFLAPRLGVKDSPHRLDAILAELSKFWLAGRTESMDRLAPRLFADMGLAPVTPRRSNVSGVTINRYVELTPDLADELTSEHLEDAMLHRAAGRFEQSYLERRPAG